MNDIVLSFKSDKLVLKQVDKLETSEETTGEYCEIKGKFFKIIYQPISPQTGAKVDRITYADLIVNGIDSEGVSICNPKDIDNKFIGQKIALEQAIEQLELFKSGRREVWEKFFSYRKKTTSFRVTRKRKINGH